ncbi:Pkinase-domain-containing protein [Aureobasidium melanogenum CBS 110374]|uniref:non-specific serine/threonine protein kinase n=1 Tax=Aureobasidium melanogenum (strain CBS 110374) TaxID=1043003 RepID=A0A074VCS1_AURM1|nr:Pkinase-domain-containing protein [Aureobasidium melanogenum CBS 110374]KEQ58123.1 Pkinase-domain-containing protein [Aureobasidium melanogenum CBS 110374]
MADDYHMLEELGSGSFGVVYKAVEKATGDLVAIKHIDLEGSDDDIQEIQQEIALLSTCSSEHVTRYKASFVRGVKLWIVMEYLGGGSCLDLLKSGPITEAQIAIIMRELLLGLDYLHNTGKIHRDIKAANVLLSSSGRVKIADFGVAAQLTNIQSQRLTFVGTPFWMAPEVIQEAGYDFKADIWSLGITAMELANGEPPHSQVHPMKVLFLIPKEKAPRLEGGTWSREFRDFVALCLNKDADTRPTAKTLLKHKFIQRAGRVDSLKLLVDRARNRIANEKKDRLRYYEQTLHELHAPNEDDDWVFDTVRPGTYHSQTVKPRDPSHMIAWDSEAEDAFAAMENLDISSGASPSYDPAATIRTSKHTSTSPSHHADPSATTRKAKQPLGLDMSFGNGASTVRQFKRVPSGGARPSSSGSSQTAVEDSENLPPAAAVMMPDTKEAILGRRAYVKCIDPALQELYASTAPGPKQTALARMAEAWNILDETDPEGELLLLKAIFERVQKDPRLAAQAPIVTEKETLVTPPTSPYKSEMTPTVRSMRRQSAFVDSEREKILRTAILEDRMPGKVETGLEHIGMLADALYGRWSEGLRMRWPNA